MNLVKELNLARDTLIARLQNLVGNKLASVCFLPISKVLTWLGGWYYIETAEY